MAYVADDARVDIVIPTSINTVLLVNENIVYNLRKQQPADIRLVSLYKRAFLVVNEVDEIGVVRRGEGGV